MEIKNGVISEIYNDSDYEKFYNIPGYNGYYKINKNSDIINKNNLYLKKSKGSRGYEIICLYEKDPINKRNHKRITHNVHSLMRLCFMKNNNKNLVVNHINGIKTDNKLSNLEIITQSENCIHARRIGLIDIEKNKIQCKKMGKKYFLVGLNSMTSNIKNLKNKSYGNI